MKGTVVNIDKGAKVSRYDVTKLTIQTDNGEKDYNFFKNAACIAKVDALQRGQMVDIKLEKNGKYWNPIDVEVVANVAGPQNEGTGKADFRSKEEIRRSVALQCAATIHDKKVEPRIVVMTAQFFEVYLEQGINPADLLDAQVEPAVN